MNARSTLVSVVMKASTCAAVLVGAVLCLLLWAAPAAAQGVDTYNGCVADHGQPVSSGTGRGSTFILTDEFEDCLGGTAQIEPITASTTDLLQLFYDHGVSVHGWLIRSAAGSRTYLTEHGHVVVLTGTLTSDGEDFAALLEIQDANRTVLAVTVVDDYVLPSWVASEMSLASRAPINRANLGLEWCLLPGELFDHCEDPVELLPMWRWSRSTHIWTDWGGNVVTSTIRAIMGGSFDMLVSIQFFIAAFLWDALARLLYLALTADFSKDMLLGIDQTYYFVMHNLLDSGLFWLVAVVGFLAACWALFRKGAEEAWRAVLSSMLPLGLAVFMLIQISNAYSPGGFPEKVEDLPTYDEPDYTTYLPGTTSQVDVGQKYMGTPAWLYTKLGTVTNEISNGLSYMAVSLTGDRNLHSSYCSVFSRQLERLYLQTVLDKRTDEEGQGAKLEARDHSPIALSRLWERAYLAGWSQAQFGDPQAAHNGSCLWAEMNASGVLPPETMVVWASTCGDVGNSNYRDLTPNIDDGASRSTITSLYGCDGRGVPLAGEVLPALPLPGHFLNYRDESRAWRTFRADNDEETLTLLAVSSACGYFSHDSWTVSETSDGTPRIYQGGQSVDVDDDGAIYVRHMNVYVETPYIGMRRNTQEKHEWFSLDACMAWMTGTKPQSSVDDKDDPVGRDKDRVEGLNDTYTKARAALGCEQARQSASNVSDNMGSISGLAQATSATAAFSAADNVCTYGGANYFNRFLYALITMLTAFAYLFSLAGLAAGTALAQILLGLIFMMLPIILLVAAVPVQAARKFLPRILKTAIGALLAHSVFLIILSFLVFIIDVVSFAVTNATDPGSSVRVISLALIPFIAKKVVAGVSKQFGFDFTSMKGALKVTSGIAAGATGGGGGGHRGGMAQRYARSMGHSMVSPYRMRSALGLGGRGMRMSPAALAGGGQGRAAAGLGGAAVGAAVGGAVGGAVKGRKSWGGPSMPGAPGAPSRQTASGRSGTSGTDGRSGAPGRDGTASGRGTDGRSGAPGRDGTASGRGTDGRSGAPGRDGGPGQPGRTGPADSTTREHQRPPTGQTPTGYPPDGAPPKGLILPGNPDLSGYDPRLQRDSARVMEQPTDVSAGGIHVPQGAELPPPPAEEPRGPVGPTDTTDYDPDRYEGGLADTARLGGHAALWGAGFARRHALLTYAAAGLAVTGVGLPAAVAVYAGGKVIKKVTRKPAQMAVGKARQGVTGGVKRWQEIRAGQSDAQMRFRQAADRGMRDGPGRWA